MPYSTAGYVSLLGGTADTAAEVLRAVLQCDA